MVPKASIAAHAVPRQVQGAVFKGPSNRLLVWLIALAALLVFVLSLARPYTTDDVLIYSLIGKAIYEKGMMPFTYAFDHKPLFTYYIYGLLAVLVPDNTPKYQVLSILAYALTALVTRAFVKRESWLVQFAILTGLAIKFLRYGANTELFFAPLALISVLLALRSRGWVGLAFAGIFAAMAFNINYIAVFAVGPAVLYTLFSNGESRPRQFGSLLVYAVGFLLGILLVFTPLLLKDPNLVAGFFAAQRKFLASYSQPQGHFVIVFFVSALPLLALLWVSLRCDAQDRRVRNILAIAAVSSFIGALVPGKFFDHYLYVMVPPLVALYALSTHAYKRVVLLVSMAALVCFSLPSFVKGFGPLQQIRAAYDFTQFRQLKEMIGDEKLLSIKAHHAITYFSDATPAQPLVWFDHARLIYGPKEDDYFLAYLEQRPRFIITIANMCNAPRAELEVPKSCDLIQARYSQVMTIADPIGWRSAFVYRLNGS